MRLDRAVIRNFRSIEKLTFHFEPRCRVLVGINESGKSNILRALSFLDEETEFDSEDLREIRPQEDPISEAYVWFVFALEAEDKADVITFLSSRVLGDLKKKPIIRIGKRKLTIADFVNTRTETLYCVDLLNKDRSKSYFALPSDAKIIAPWKWLSTTSRQSADKALQVIDSDHRDAPEDLEDLTVENLNQLVATAFHPLLDDQMPTVIFWKYDEDQLLPGRINISEFSNDPETCLPLKHMF